MNDTDNNETKLEYEDGLLVRIVDIDEKVTRFDYYNDTLSRVTYPDSTTSDYAYIGEFNFLAAVANPAGYGIRLDYDHKKIIKAEEFSNTYEITREGLRGADEEQSRVISTITYNTHFSTTTTDRVQNSTTYIFDIMGKPVMVYDGIYADPGEDTKSVSIDYDGSDQSFSIAENIQYDNILKGVSAESNTLAGNPLQIRQANYKVDITKIPYGVTDFVLSVWAEADAAFTPTNRKTDYSHSLIDSAHTKNADFYKTNRKFELRAELTYDDGNKDVYTAAFDWLNSDWQYLALPVTIKEEDETGNRLSGSFPFVLGGESRKLVSMSVIVDYSYNTNDILIDCLTLRQGSWSYSESDGNGKRVYSEDDKSNITSYIYDENERLIKTVLIDKKYRKYINTYEYNKQNKLIRSTDYKGLVEESEYDEKGRAVKTVTYNISDPTSKFYSESVRDEKGRVTADIDITGEFNSAEYGFDRTGAVNVIKDADGNKAAFGYQNDELVSISGDCGGEENKNELKSTLGYTTRVSTGATDYSYIYDGWGRQKGIAIAEEKYAETEYIEDEKTKELLATKTTLATGESFTDYELGSQNIPVEDFMKRDDIPAGVKIAETVNAVKIARTEYVPAMGGIQELTVGAYDEKTGLIALSIDKSGQKQYTTTYIYDKEGRLSLKEEDGAGPLEQEIEYNDNGGIKYNRYEINGVGQTYYYEYENVIDDKQIKVTLPGGAEQIMQYDGLARLTNTKHSDVFTKDIYYAKYGDHATNYISSVWHGVNGKRNENTRYSYDKTGNIVSIKENGQESVRYTYDSLNRLIREDNAIYEKIGAQVGKTETYEYDNSGNILAKTRYEYTVEDKLAGGVRTEYNYATSGWKDQLTSYTSEAIGNYDDLGNPWKYRNKQLKWERGRNLTGYDYDEAAQNYKQTYTYNASGIRTSKTVNGIETTYYLDGNKIIAEEQRDKNNKDILIDALYYRYGADGITGFEYRRPDADPKTYVYRKNIQGDITHIFAESGEVLVKYQPKRTYKIDFKNPFKHMGNTSVCGRSVFISIRFASYKLES